jgi:hypothetical protein
MDFKLGHYPDFVCSLRFVMGLLSGGYPPGGLVVKSPMVAIDSEIDLAKILQPLGLRLNSAKQKSYWCGLFLGRKSPGVLPGLF